MPQDTDIGIVHRMAYRSQWYLLHIIMEDGQAELTWVAVYIMRWFTCLCRLPIPLLTGPDVEQLLIVDQEEITRKCV